MRCVSRDVYLERLHPAVLMKLADCLDANYAWKQLISAMPYDCSSGLIEVIERDQYRPGLSAGKLLLQRLYSKLVRVSELVEWLEEAELLKPLLLLKADEPLQITREPEQFLTLCEGYQLRLSCRATSFPPPEFQWFKDDEELLLQQEPDLIIENAGGEHSGAYFCRIRAYHSERPSECITRTSLVSVVPQFNDGRNRKQKAPSWEYKKFNNDNYEEFGNLSTIEENSKFTIKEECDIEITEQPFSPGKVSQGCHVILKVRATSAYDLNYQWYCNGREMKGETKKDLVLGHVFADRERKEFVKKYQCVVSNKIGHVFSDCVTLELLPANESTQYEAEEKIALLIANEYFGDSEPLVLPSSDVESVAKLLNSEVDFKIISLKNLNYVEMKNAIEKYCETLGSGKYGFVYVAGHGFQLGKQTYLMPTDCNADFKNLNSKQILEKTICTDCILNQMQNKNPALIVQMFDVCRTTPKGAEKLTPPNCCQAKVKGNTFRCYSTASFCAALEDGRERNGYFVKHLSKFLSKERKPIEEIFKKIQVEFRHDVNVDESQCPTAESSLNEFRTLADKVIKHGRSSVFDETFSWADYKANLFAPQIFDIYFDESTEESTSFPSVMLTFSHHKETFCNSMDVSVHLDVPDNASLNSVRGLDVSVEFRGLKTITKRRNYTCTSGSIFLIKVIEVHDIQRFKGNIVGKVLVDDKNAGARLLEEEFVLGEHPISTMKLSVT